MSWCFRLMKRNVSSKPDWYNVVEYYEEENGDRSWTERGVGPKGETPEECKADYELMSEAFRLPILDERQLEKEIGARKGEPKWV